MAKNNILQVRITDEMKYRLKEMAHKKSMSVGALVTYYCSTGLQSDNLLAQVLTTERMQEYLGEGAKTALEQLIQESAEKQNKKPKQTTLFGEEETL